MEIQHEYPTCQRCGHVAFDDYYYPEGEKDWQCPKCGAGHRMTVRPSMVFLMELEV